MKNSLAIRNCSSQKVSGESEDVEVLLNSRGSLWHDKKGNIFCFTFSYIEKKKKSLEIMKIKTAFVSPVAAF